MTTLDHTYLDHAYSLAKIRRGFCAPNPAVGAVLTLNHKIIATGYHHACGSPHAEVEALNKVNNQALGATLYVSLEPCCHWGRTPPCTDAIIQAGIKRVIYGYQDPNPKVGGKGAALLQANGIECEHLSLPAIDAFYESYQHWLKEKIPFVTAKIALSLNGKIAGKEGERISLTGQVLQEFTHASRKATDAILTTVRTVIQDDPQLNARCTPDIIAKPIYILDSQLQLPLTATLFKTAKSLSLFHAKTADAMRQQQLTDLGVRCIAVDSNADGLDLQQVVRYIGQEGVHDLWVEAGGKCFAAFVTQKLLQRAYLYIAPCWRHDGQDAFAKEFSLDLSACKIHWEQRGNDALCTIRW